MCGIAGIITDKPDSELQRIVGGMARKQAHRGPDGDGYYISSPIGLGHLRLSIIDLALGKQPICNEDRSVWITFNGEIYNFNQIRTELVSLGHRFSTNSDTEVIVHGYEEWGTGILNKLRGMFAFALADFNRKSVLIARDPFGIKPLVYAATADSFYFASELNGLVEGFSSPPKGDASSVDTFLRYGYIPYPNTIYKDVWKLPPGHFLEVAFDGSFTKPESYWDFTFAPKHLHADKEWLSRIDQRIDESVAAHTIADVPFGVFLSGGIDSTLVASSLRRFEGQPSKAFCMDFSQPEFSEAAYAREAAAKIGHQLFIRTIDKVSLDEIKQIVLQYGEPFGDSSSIATWQVAALAREHVPLVLSGDGGDELFAGYTYNYVNALSFAPFFRMRRGLIQRKPRKFASGLKELMLSPFRRRTSPFQRYVRSMSDPGDRELRHRLLTPSFRHHARIPNSSMEEMGRRCNNEPDFLRAAQKFDILNYLPNDILTKVDIATMAHGLEARPPLIDKELYELSLSVPSRLNFGLVNGQFEGKKILKSILTKLGFSDSFVFRPKKGFTVPRKLWLTKGGIGFEKLIAVVKAERHPVDQILDRSELTRILDAHERREKDHTKLLWYILVFAIWAEHHLELEFV